MGLVLVAALDLKSARNKGPFGYFAIGCALGTLFGQTSVAALWTALGPARLYRRVLFSLVWLILLVSATLIGFRLEDVSIRSLPMVAASLGMQWVLIQIPLWLQAFAYGLRLQLDAEEQTGAGKPQFGLGQLMVFTFGVAVVLGVSRWVVASGVLEFRNHELPIFLFLAAAAVLTSLPLTLAALMPRLAWLGVLLVLVLVALATAWELSLLTRFFSRGGPQIMHLVGINGSTSAWVLAFVTAARLQGWRLGRSRKGA